MIVTRITLQVELPNDYPLDNEVQVLCENTQAMLDFKDRFLREYRRQLQFYIQNNFAEITNRFALGKNIDKFHTLVLSPEQLKLSIIDG